MYIYTLYCNKICYYWRLDISTAIKIYLMFFFFYKKRLHKKNQSHDPSSPMILSDLEQQQQQVLMSNIHISTASSPGYYFNRNGFWDDLQRNVEILAATKPTQSRGEKTTTATICNFFFVIFFFFCFLLLISSIFNFTQRN